MDGDEQRDEAWERAVDIWLLRYGVSGVWHLEI
jgi:hypothetical protein